jgi:hypothetical protein
LILFHSIDPGAAERLNASRVMAAQRRDVAHWLREAIKSGEVSERIEPEAEAESIVGSMAGIIFQSLIDPAISMHKLSAKLKADIAARIGPALAEPVAPRRDDRAVLHGRG